MAYAIRNTLIGNQPIEQVSTDQRHPLGTEVQAVDPVYGEGTFVYLKGAASTVLGSAVLINSDDWSSSLLAPDNIGPVGIAMGPTVAGSFGWYQRIGKAIARVAAGFVDNANVYATSTPGVLDDAVVAGDRVKNCKGASAISGGLAEMEIDRPFVDDALAA